MSEPKFTPGPWTFGIGEYGNDSKFVINPKSITYAGAGHYDNPAIFGADGSNIVGCDEYMVFDKPENIALILTAPELYEALEEVVRISDRDHEAWVKAKAALAKARGEG